MTPMPETPVIAVLVSVNGIQRIATNISSNVRVEITDNVDRFNELASNKPFVIAPPVEQCLAD